MTNLAVAQAVAGQFTHALIDEKAHVCLRDATEFLGCPVLDFKNCDPADVARLVKQCGQNARLILLTDGLYSGPGTVAPLVEYLQVLPKQALVLVDDAHGAGVVGPTGKGSPEFTGAQRRRLVQTMTLSKAFGVYGGVVLCSRKLRQQIVNRSHCFIGSTPLPLPLVNAALTAIRLHRTGAELRRRLRRNVARVCSALRAAGVAVPDGAGAVVPIYPRSTRHASALRRALLAAGIYPSFIKYPSGPATGYFRFVISSAHTPAQLDNLSGVLGRVCALFGELFWKQ
jgi:7-keto-8-aminopelargonate synthetase-like enzyme